MHFDENYIEIKTLLENVHGLDVTIEKKSVTITDDTDEQAIIEQSLEVGTEVRKGDEITLYIPDVYEEYPDFVGENWLVSDVEEFCEKNNIKLTIEYQETNQYAPGKIISQSRTGRIVSGATLKIVVAEEISLPEEIAPTPDDEENTEEDN